MVVRSPQGRATTWTPIDRQLERASAKSHLHQRFVHQDGARVTPDGGKDAPAFENERLVRDFEAVLKTEFASEDVLGNRAGRFGHGGVVAFPGAVLQAGPDQILCHLSSVVPMIRWWVAIIARRPERRRQQRILSRGVPQLAIAATSWWRSTSGGPFNNRDPPPKNQTPGEPDAALRILTGPGVCGVRPPGYPGRHGRALDVHPGYERRPVKCVRTPSSSAWTPGTWSPDAVEGKGRKSP